MLNVPLSSSASSVWSSTATAICRPIATRDVASSRSATARGLDARAALQAHMEAPRWKLPDGGSHVGASIWEFPVGSFHVNCQGFLLSWPSACRSSRQITWAGIDRAMSLVQNASHEPKPKPYLRSSAVQHQLLVFLSAIMGTVLARPSPPVDDVSPPPVADLPVPVADVPEAAPAPPADAVPVPIFCATVAGVRYHRHSGCRALRHAKSVKPFLPCRLCYPNGIDADGSGEPA